MSILNQCNTILGMRVYDTTGMGFLENYIGQAHARVLGTLKKRQAVFFGRASSCEAPIVIQLNDAGDFRDRFWVDVVGNIPRTPRFDDLAGPPAAAIEPGAAPEEPPAAELVQWEPEEAPDDDYPEVEDDEPRALDPDDYLE